MVPLPVSRDVDIRQKSKIRLVRQLRALKVFVIHSCTYFTAVWLMKRQFLILSQWANLSVHELKENNNDKMWNIPTTDS